MKGFLAESSGQKKSSAHFLKKKFGNIFPLQAGISLLFEGEKGGP